MIKQEAVVTRVDAESITIKSLVQSACAGCASKTTCGASIYNQFLPNREITIKSHQKVNVGDHVEVGIQSQHLAYASMVVYCVPLICMLAVVSLYEGSDIASAGVGLLGLGAGLWLVNRLQHWLLQFIVPPVIIT